MGRAYEGSLLQWIDQHGGATYTADQLFQMAQAEGKDYPYDKIRSARNVRRGVTVVLGPNGAPIKGTITKQQQAKPRLGPDERQPPGHFSNHPHKPEAPRVAAPAPAPVKKKMGRPPKVRPEVSVPAAVQAIGAAMKAPQPDPRQRALDLGIRKPVPLVSPPAAARTAVALPVPKAPPKAIRVNSEPEHAEPDHGAHLLEELPPAKHTALRKLILDVGLDTARQIIDEFEDVSERIR